MVRRTTLIMWGRLAVFAAGATFTLAACSSEPTTNPTPATPTTQTSTSASPTSPASPVDKAKQDALAAYKGMWRDFVAAAATSDWRSTKLGQHTTGTALNNLSRSLYADHSNGLVTKGEPTFSPSVTSVEPVDAPKKIIVSDCSDSSKSLKYRADNGQLADDKPGGRHRINAIVNSKLMGHGRSPTSACTRWGHAKHKTGRRSGRSNDSRSTWCDNTGVCRRHLRRSDLRTTPHPHVTSLLDMAKAVQAVGPTLVGTPAATAAVRSIPSRVGLCQLILHQVHSRKVPVAGSGCCARRMGKTVRVRFGSRQMEVLRRSCLRLRSLKWRANGCACRVRGSLPAHPAFSS